MSQVAKGTRLIQKADTRKVLRKVRSEVRRLDRHVVSPSLFQNKSGIAGNLGGWLSLQLAGRRSNGAKANRSEGIEFRDKQFETLGQPYDESLIDSIRNAFDRYVSEDEHTFTLEYDGTVYSRQLRSFQTGDTPPFDFAEKIPQINELFNPEIREIVQTYYSSYFRPEYVQLYRNFHIPPEVMAETEIFSNNWHNDGRPVDFAKLFVNLSDVTEDDGPFHVITRDETRKLVSRSYDRHVHGVPGGMVEENAKPVMATGAAGSAMVANTNLSLHRAGVPEEGRSRDVAVIQLVPASEPLPEDWLSAPSVQFDRNGRSVRELLSFP